MDAVEICPRLLSHSSISEWACGVAQSMLLPEVEVMLRTEHNLHLMTDDPHSLLKHLSRFLVCNSWTSTKRPERTFGKSNVCVRVPVSRTDLCPVINCRHRATTNILPDNYIFGPEYTYWSSGIGSVALFDFHYQSPTHTVHEFTSRM